MPTTFSPAATPAYAAMRDRGPARLRAEAVAKAASKKNAGGEPKSILKEPRNKNQTAANQKVNDLLGSDGFDVYAFLMSSESSSSSEEEVEEVQNQLSFAERCVQLADVEKKKEDEKAPVPEMPQLTPEEESFNSTTSTAALVSFVVVALLAMGSAGGEITSLVTTLLLALIGGAQVVYGVVPALHSPLMSVTNAVSGLTVVGGVLLMGGSYMPETLPQWLGAVAAFVSMVNIGGGFVMTNRMLDMFKREGDVPQFEHFYAIPAALFVSLYAVGSYFGYFDLFVFV